MESTQAFIDPFLKKAEAFSKTSLELAKLKAVDKSATVTSSIISRLFFLSIVFIFVLLLNIAISLWLGEMLGNIYNGFFVVAIFYGVLAAILLLLHTTFKRKMSNYFITQMLN